MSTREMTDAERRHYDYAIAYYVENMGDDGRPVRTCTNGKIAAGLASDDLAWLGLPGLDEVRRIVLQIEFEHNTWISRSIDEFEEKNGCYIDEYGEGEENMAEIHKRSYDYIRTGVGNPDALPEVRGYFEVSPGGYSIEHADYLEERDRAEKREPINGGDFVYIVSNPSDNGKAADIEVDSQCLKKFNVPVGKELVIDSRVGGISVHDGGAIIRIESMTPKHLSELHRVIEERRSVDSMPISPGDIQDWWMHRGNPSYIRDVPAEGRAE